MKTRKPLPYKRNPHTLGEHLKKKRTKLGIRQKDVATALEINTWTYILWENDETKPNINQWPRIIRFLGYDLHCRPKTFGEHLLWYRRQNGLNRKKLATLIGADEHTVWQWETDKKVPIDERHIAAIEALKFDKM